MKNINEKNYIIVPELGAFMTIIPGHINSLEKLINYTKYGIQPFAYLKDLINNGYVLRLGPNIPNEDGSIYKQYNGLYCVNYNEFIEEKNSARR